MSIIEYGKGPIENYRAKLSVNDVPGPDEPWVAVRCCSAGVSDRAIQLTLEASGLQKGKSVVLIRPAELSDQTANFGEALRERFGHVKEVDGKVESREAIL